MNGTALRIQDIFSRKENASAAVQDKRPRTRSTAASQPPQTAAATSSDRKQHGSEKRQTVGIYSRVKPHIEYGLGQLAKARGRKWTKSKVIAEACEAYLANDLGEKFGVRLATLVTQAIDRAIQQHSNREASISFQSAYASEQDRILLIHILRYLLIIEGGGMDQNGAEVLTELPLIIANAQTQALHNLKHPIRRDDNKQ